MVKNKLSCILLVDDDPISTFLCSEVLSELNITVNVVVENNCLDALESIKNGFIPELIFLELRTNGADGLEFLKALNKNPDRNKNKGFVSTAHYTLDQMLQLELAGVEGIVLKPFTVEKARELIERHFT